MDPISKFAMDYLIEGAAQLIMPLMILAFVGGIVLRASLYYLLRAQRKFATEFERRVRTYHDDPSIPRVESFSRILRILLTKTHHEVFELRRKFQRRRADYAESLVDRLFLVEEGMSRLTNDVVYQARYLRKQAGHDTGPARFLDLARQTHEGNPYFNRLFGAIPTATLHDHLNALPSLFVIGGIFGTFLGIAKSLPELGGMDLANAAETKAVMDAFLVAISQAMIKSIMGIGFSIAMTLINTTLSLDGVFVQTLGRFASSLEQLWAESATNEAEPLPADAPPPSPRERRAA